jgi:hypothetical protein
LVRVITELVSHAGVYSYVLCVTYGLIVLDDFVLDSFHHVFHVDWGVGWRKSESI